MSVAHFSVDGVTWYIGCTIERVAEITPSDISGMLLDRSYFNDVIGTYLKYDVKLEVPFGAEQSYSALYEVLNEPVDAHSFVLPYGGGTIEITGRVEQISDVYMRLPSGTIHWKGISFSVIANHPTKQMSLGDVITRGASPLPDESDVSVGEVYIYSSGGWETVPDADDNYY